MASKNMLAGRFLPSRVYARWKGTARFGLCTLPLILFLAGGVTDDANREQNSLGKWVEIHSPPAISNTPVGKAADESLGGMILQALGVGLGFSLLAPYLLEFAFPRRSRRRVPVKQRTEWSEPCDEPAASGTPANS